MLAAYIIQRHRSGFKADTHYPYIGPVHTAVCTGSAYRPLALSHPFVPSNK